VAVRSSGAETSGIRLGGPQSIWNKFALPTTDDSGARSLAYGGYRWGNELSLEAAIATSDRLPPVPDTLATRRGVGLTVASGDASAQIRNVDVYTTWGFAKAFSLYGRLGYKETDAVSFYPAPNAGSDGRRNRDGVNYGVGLRYDMTPVLGLRFEYARFSRVTSESLITPFGETDQVQLGLQFRF
jgi:opacity protein-like surface antigen